MFKPTENNNKSNKSRVNTSNFKYRKQTFKSSKPGFRRFTGKPNYRIRPPTKVVSDLQNKTILHEDTSNIEKKKDTFENPKTVFRKRTFNKYGFKPKTSFSNRTQSNKNNFKTKTNHASTTSAIKKYKNYNPLRKHTSTTTTEFKKYSRNGNSNFKYVNRNYRTRVPSNNDKLQNTEKIIKDEYEEV